MPPTAWGDNEAVKGNRALSSCCQTQSVVVRSRRKSQWHNVIDKPRSFQHMQTSRAPTPKLHHTPQGHGKTGCN
eukprot:4008260-Amphidinium_carterae.1